MSTYQGSSTKDVLKEANWDYDWDTFYMNDGDDRVSTPLNTNVAYKFYGGYGNDYFVGDTANDTVYGNQDNDDLNGYTGDDKLYGGQGNDTLYGGEGSDYLDGGLGSDRLRGDAGRDYVYGGRDHASDTFVYFSGESNAANGQSDIIYDWNESDDFIDTSSKGTSSNYAEAETTAIPIGKARAQAEGDDAMAGKTHVFLYNARTDTGFLLSDLDHDGSFETGVIIKGAGSAADMNFADII